MQIASEDIQECCSCLSFSKAAQGKGFKKKKNFFPNFVPYMELKNSWNWNNERWEVKDEKI